jgi:hypothetical protein
VTLPESLAPRLQPPQGCPACPEPGTARPAHRVLQARVCQGEAQGGLPGNPPPHRLGRPAGREVLDTLAHGRQCQPGGGCGRLPPAQEQIRTLCSGGNRAKPGGAGQTQRPVGKRSAGHLWRLGWKRRDSLGLERQR